jgi:peptide chain release factor
MNKHIIVVTAGYGPLEVRQFVAQLAERIEVVCEELGLVVEEVVVHGDEHTPGSVDLLVRGDELLLANELGTHALVARSSHRGKASRKRWYASVSLHDAPKVAEEDAAAIDPRDVEITTMRSSGPGGQNVNKTSTAVRIRHLPSGLAVRASDERSQKANLRRAMARLSALLRAREDRHLARQETAKWSSHARIERGQAVRTYTLSHRGELRMCTGEGN